MTDNRPLQPHSDDLESQLRDHYRDIAGASASDVLLATRIDRAIDRSMVRTQAKLEPGQRVRGQRVRGAFGFRAFAGVVGATAVLAAVGMIANLLLAGSPTTGGPTASGSQNTLATPTATVSTVPMQQPPANPSAVLAGARTTALGSVPGGGVWWAQPDSFGFVPDSTHSGGFGPWPVSDTEPPTIYVLDKDHMWTVSLGPGSSNAYAGQGLPFDHLRAVVNSRSATGTQPGTQSTVPGDYPDSVFGISFVDPRHGFLMCSNGRPGETSTILRSDDGGATWKVVATPTLMASGGAPGPTNLGGMFTASDATTLWAGAQEEAGGHGHPLLAVSRDGGISWSAVNLPGMGAYVGGFDVFLMEPPVFLDSNTGFVTVIGGPGASTPNVYMTTDAGHTWTLQSVPFQATTVDFIDAAHWVVPAGATVELTTDGGKTWHSGLGHGLPAGQFKKLAFFDSVHGYGLFGPTRDQNSYLYQTVDGGDDWILVSNAS